MPSYTTADIRNIALLGGAGSGKRHGVYIRGPAVVPQLVTLSVGRRPGTSLSQQTSTGPVSPAAPQPLQDNRMELHTTTHTPTVEYRIVKSEPARPPVGRLPGSPERFSVELRVNGRPCGAALLTMTADQLAAVTTEPGQVVR